jgi:hypothetical protein
VLLPIIGCLHCWILWFVLFLVTRTLHGFRSQKHEMDEHTIFFINFLKALKYHETTAKTLN